MEPRSGWSRPPGYWNIWWTLAVLSAALGLAAVILESFGILGELGTVIGFASLALTVLFGLTGSTRASVRRVEFALDGMAARVDGLGDKLDGLGRLLEDIRGILFDRLPPR